MDNKSISSSYFRR